jgi:hypothetical protein
MQSDQSIEVAISALEQASIDSIQSPAIVRLAPDNDAYVLGNRDGYVKLAIASLRAAQGNDQSFKDTPWVSTEELDFGFSGLRYDPAAHTYLRPPRTRVGRVTDKLLLLVFSVLGIAVLGTFSVGLIHIISWFKRLF